MNHEIIIDINEANRAQKYKKENELFQIEAFKKVTDILKKHSCGENTDSITDCRFHDTIFIDGDRGVGKTAFMLNIKNYYDEIDKDKKQDILFLDPVDPTLLEHTEKFLSVILARIVEKVKYEVDSSCKSIDLKDYYDALEKLSQSLSAIKTLDTDLGIEEISSSKSSLKLEQNAHNFFKIICEIFKVKALVMLIDDIDMAFDKGFDVLEVVRKYLASPYLVPIVAGDIKLYREIIETQFMSKINFSEDIKHLKAIYSEDEIRYSDGYKKKKELLDNLVEQYLHKVFPSDSHIQLKDIFTILKKYNVNIRFEDGIKISYSEIKKFEIKHINLGIEQDEFCFEVFSNNTRDFMQYLNTKKDIYKNYFENIEQHVFIDNMNLYEDSFRKTSEFYKDTYDRKKKELAVLTDNDYQSFYNNVYSLYKAFTSNRFTTLNKFKGIEKSVDSYSIKAQGLKEILNKDDGYKNISNYIIDLFIFNDYYSSYQRRNYIYSGKFLEAMIYSFSKEKLSNQIDREWIEAINNEINKFSGDNIENLGTFQDINEFENLNNEIYSILYDTSSKDATNTTLSDKFNDIIVNEEIIEINKLKKIANKIPLGSEFLINNRYKKEDWWELDSADINESENKYDLTELSRAISIWRSVFLNKVKLNSISLYEIIYKFFTNIEKIKLRNRTVHVKVGESIQLRTVELDELKANKPILYLQRIVLIFINSIAFFESDEGKVANVNIAINNEFNLENVLSKTSASLLNIKPMFNKKDSLTRALFFHPIISHILFPKNESKLNNLEFIGQKFSSETLETKIKENIGLNKKQLSNRYHNIYKKYFKDNTYKEGISVNNSLEEYLTSIINIFEKLNATEQFTSKDILSKNKYDKVYELMKKDVATNNVKINKELVKKYDDLVYGK